MTAFDVALLLGALLLISGVVASKASGRLGVPALLLFLVIGMLAGSEGPGGIAFDDATLARNIGIVALILILYAGGLDTDWRDTRPVLVRGAVLSSVATFVTAGLVGLFVTLIAGVSLLEGLLLGSIVSSTDAAAVFALLRGKGLRLRKDLRALLELESGSNDPTAVFLTVTMIGLVQGASGGAVVVFSFVLQMSVGVAVGYVLSKLAVLAINKAQLDYDGLYPVLSLAVVFLVYGIAVLARGNGFLAVYVAGLTMGNSVFIHKRSITRFHDGLGWLMQITMFLTLGLLASPSRLPAIAGAGLAVAAFLIFIARPLAILALMVRSRFSWAARVFVSLVGLRGAAPIILATFPLVANVTRADTIFDLVFFIVLASMLVQGTALPWLTQVLRLKHPELTPDLLQTDELSGGRLVEYVVHADSAVIGKQVAKMGLPETARALLIRRYDSHLVVTGGTRVRRDDVILILADETAVNALDQSPYLVRAPDMAALWPAAPEDRAAGAAEGEPRSSPDRPIL